MWYLLNDWGLSVIIIGLAVLLYFGWKTRHSDTKNEIPSGPIGLPFVGNLHQLIFSKNPFETLFNLAERHGKMYTLHFGSHPALVINDAKLMKQLLGVFASTGKFQTDSFLIISQGPYGILNSEGDKWAEIRSYCVKKLKEFGFGSRALQPLILQEAEEFCCWVKCQQKHSDGIIIKPALIQAVTNVLWSMVTGKRIHLGESKIVTLVDKFIKAFQYTAKTGLVILPWLKYVAPALSGYTEFNQASRNVHRFIENEFHEHKKDFIEGSCRDLIDAYIENAKDDPEKLRMASSVVVELFVASSESTGTASTWLLFYLCLNDSVQKKVYQEIQNVLGRQHEPSLEDKARMPYCEAVILETLRLSTFGPVGMVHRLLETIKFQEFTLPKGMLLVPNLYYCHHNERIWGDPKSFRPERFLEDNGSFNSIREYLIPFQTGRRQCPGEPLAKDVLFLFLVKIIQQFEIAPAAGINPDKYVKPDVGFVFVPQEAPVVMIPRD